MLNLTENFQKHAHCNTVCSHLCTLNIVCSHSFSSYIKYTINYCSFLYLTRMKVITHHYCSVPIISIILNRTGIFFNRTGWDLPEPRFQIPSCSEEQDGNRQKINMRLTWEFFCTAYIVFVLATDTAISCFFSLGSVVFKF